MRGGYWVDEIGMDASQYAFLHGVRATRGALLAWRRRPWPVLSAWFVGSLGVSVLLLLAVLLISVATASRGVVSLDQPPFHEGGLGQIFSILGHNLLVLALHAMAC